MKKKPILYDQVVLEFRAPKEALSRKEVSRLHRRLKYLRWAKLLHRLLGDFPSLTVVDASGGSK
jgi:hypothetical protein